MASGAQFKPEYYNGKDNASPTYLVDGVNPLLIATIAQFHNSDGQALPSTAYGILTGGVDQLINAAGTLDRKRSAYSDALPTTGIEASGLMLWNGATFDRWKGDNGVARTEDIEAANYVGASSPPSTTNAGTDTTYTFSSQVNRVIIQNNTSANVNYAFDTAASPGTLRLLPGATLIYPKKCTALHLYTAAAQNINGSTAGNIVVLGAL